MHLNVFLCANVNYFFNWRRKLFVEKHHLVEVLVVCVDLGCWKSVDVWLALVEVAFLYHGPDQLVRKNRSHLLEKALRAVNLRNACNPHQNQRQRRHRMLRHVWYLRHGQ